MTPDPVTAFRRTLARALCATLGHRHDVHGMSPLVCRRCGWREAIDE